MEASESLISAPPMSGKRSFFARWRIKYEPVAQFNGGRRHGGTGDRFADSLHLLNLMGQRVHIGLKTFRVFRQGDDELFQFAAHGFPIDMPVDRLVGMPVDMLVDMPVDMIVGPG